jgi:hypothetical protein
MPAPSTRCLRCVCLLPLVLALGAGGCGAATMRSTATAPLTAAERAQLWVEPDNLASRDLFHGPGGASRAPALNTTYKVKSADMTGHSAGYDVEDSEGREWRIKLGDEVQSELVASRLLWAIGFHQPATYFLRNWKMEGGRHEDQGLAARFRLEDGYKVASSWSWQENPYVGTSELKGLVVANLLLNNWDFKTTQNRIYQVSDEALGPRTWYVVQDLGAALGASRWPTGNRNNVASFETQQLIDRVEGGIVKFDYHGRHRELLEDITPADVVWACELFARLTEAQWKDAFRAANYSDATATRFIAKLRAKVQEGLALSAQIKATQ